MLRLFFIFYVCTLFCGCAGLRFKTERKSRFTDIDANMIQVEYGKEKRTETLSNGAELTFDNKVRVTLENGKKFILYQTLARSGVRYQSANKRFIFYEKGQFCQFLEKGVVIYKGMFNKNLTPKKKKIRRF